jgi:hypothetical protein
MAEPTTEPKVDTSAEPKLAETETKLVTDPAQGEGEVESAKEENASAAPVCVFFCAREILMDASCAEEFALR